jgi:hypothetical protein
MYLLLPQIYHEENWIVPTVQNLFGDDLIIIIGGVPVVQAAANTGIGRPVFLLFETSR